MVELTKINKELTNPILIRNFSYCLPPVLGGQNSAY